ncbi:MAG: hypothetical protein WCC58_04480 [Burkholderiales bacterium]
MMTEPTAFTGTTAHERSAKDRERDEQAYYKQHANPELVLSGLKWLAVLLFVFVWTAAFAEDNVRIDKAQAAIQTEATAARNEAMLNKSANRYAAAAPLTTLIDGPTGYVFVYTADGWKFARSLKND